VSLSPGLRSSTTYAPETAAPSAVTFVFTDDSVSAPSWDTAPSKLTVRFRSPAWTALSANSSASVRYATVPSPAPLAAIPTVPSMLRARRRVRLIRRSVIWGLA
jgi:hypothetical protein